MTFFVLRTAYRELRTLNFQHGITRCKYTGNDEMLEWLSSFENYSYKNVPPCSLRPPLRTPRYTLSCYENTAHTTLLFLCKEAAALVYILMEIPYRNVTSQLKGSILHSFSLQGRRNFHKSEGSKKKKEKKTPDLFLFSCSRPFFFHFFYIHFINHRQDWFKRINIIE